MIVYVTGMHSSGTSLVSRYLSLCGVDMMGEHVDKRMYAGGFELNEHPGFRKISHQILRDSKIHRYNNSFERKSLRVGKPTLELMKKQAHQAQVRSKGKTWGFKAPINSLTIWEWLPLLRSLDHVTILHVFREPREVIKSFLRRKSQRDINFVRQQGRGNPEKYLEEVWLAYNLSVLEFYGLYKVSDNFVFICTNNFLKRPDLLCEELGLEYKPIDDVLMKGNFIEDGDSVSPRMYRNPVVGTTIGTLYKLDIWNKWLGNRSEVSNV